MPIKKQSGLNEFLKKFNKCKKMVYYSDLTKIIVKECNEKLLDLTKCLPDILAKYQQFDMYAYTKDKFFLRKTCIDMLKKASEILKKILPKAKLLIVYAYRHPEVQQKYFQEQCDLMKQKYPFIKKDELFLKVHQMIAVPTVAGHPTGAAIDLTIQIENEVLDMGTKIADFSDSEKIMPFSKNVTQVQYNNRMLLRAIMLEAGFAPFDGEWWHFSYGDKEWAGFYNKAFAIYEQVYLDKK